MPEKDGKIKYSFLYRALIKCCRAVPLTLRRGLFTAIALLYYHLFPRHRLIALHNLKLAFPEKNMGEIITIAKGVYINIAIVWAEFFDIPSLSKDNVADIMETEGLDNCREALKRGRGVLLFSAHFGNWELSAAALSLLLAPIVVLYRRLDNAFLDDLVFLVRASTGNMPLDKEKAMRQMLRSLQNNMIVGILIDQNMAKREGVFVDFFSRPACTTDAVAQLALRSRAAVIPSFSLRMPDGRYRIILGREMEILETGDWDSDMVVNTQNFTRVVEEMVRKHPDHWLWVHYRWKTKPWQAR
ncbi:MAG TPA: lysophospholipid acyltransferase family protein [Syntrophales bacterium]|nr:lysophospholipid acyltransferase family protein [Syntrophales bacterium]